VKPIERIGVWERNRFGTLVEYVCFRELDTGRYWCWGSNHFQPEYFESLETFADIRLRQDFDIYESLRRLGSPFELGCEGETFETIEEAIAFHFPNFGKRQRTLTACGLTRSSSSSTTHAGHHAQPGAPTSPDCTPHAPVPSK
jgi:hypothetical protein